jgi:hypothetical protein
MTAIDIQDFPPHIQHLVINIAEVTRLIEIHSEIGGTGPGRRHNVEVLNRSAIVLLVACWESFVEDLAEEAFDFMLQNATDPTVFPARVLSIAGKGLKDAEDAREIWNLAGVGWRTVLTAHRQTILNEFTGTFNTPRPSKIDPLFEKLIGLNNFSRTWRWRGMPNNRAVNNLEALVTRRGEIAHQVTAGAAVRRNYVESSLELIYQLGAVASNVVRNFLIERTGNDPWVEIVRFRGAAV